MNPLIIDSHAHCGTPNFIRTHTSDDYLGQNAGLDDYLEQIAGTKISRVVMLASVMEIYDRKDSNFQDNPHWQQSRKNANEYLERLKCDTLDIYPYFFIWNDFAVEQLSSNHLGIKWHRHPDEPIYFYDDPKCKKAIDEIRRRNLHILLEEELINTVKFVNEIAPGVRIIIPHMGTANGGYDAINEHGLWGMPNIYADTSMARPEIIMKYIEQYGHERLFFGSDFPFGNVKSELEKVQQLEISEWEKEEILGKNIYRLLGINEQE